MVVELLTQRWRHWRIGNDRVEFVRTQRIDEMLERAFTTDQLNVRDRSVRG